MNVYDRDPDAAPDEDFEPGMLEHLVAGNRGRLLDARRTPVVVTQLIPHIGMFEVEITAFEDIGARWEIEAEHIERFQFEPRQATASAETVTALEDASQRFDRELSIPCEAADRDQTLARIAVERTRARSFVPDRFDAYLEERGLAEMDETFAAQFVSNPASGELVKGHAIVLAKLGLCEYTGKVVRRPELFAGQWSEERRANHIVGRLSFVRELFALDGVDYVMLYRGLASDMPLERPRPRSFLSATFDPAVAQAHFDGGPTTVAAALYRQSIPVERVFMTHRETRAMNRRFLESEAVLIGDPASPCF